MWAVQRFFSTVPRAHGRVDRRESVLMGDVSAQGKPRQLPTWFLANRVKGTTRLAFGPWHDKPEFTQAAGRV